jgi:hypothetical protein
MNNTTQHVVSASASTGDNGKATPCACGPACKCGPNCQCKPGATCTPACKCAG